MESMVNLKDATISRNVGLLQNSRELSCLYFLCLIGLSFNFPSKSYGCWWV